MRKFAAILTSLALFGTQAAVAEGLFGTGKLVFDGSMEVLGNQASNETDANGAANDHRGSTITRMRLGIDLPEIADGVSGHIELVRNSGGQVVATSTGTVAMYGSDRPTSGTSELDAIQIQNAYVDVHDFLGTDKFRLGRQYGGRKGDLLLYYGPNRDDAMSVNAFDSLMVGRKFGKVDALFSTGKVVDDDVVSNTDADDTLATGGDVNVSYLILSSDELIPNHRIPLEVGYYQVNAANAATTADNQNLVIQDLRVGHGFMDDALNVGLEYAMNGGQDNNGASPDMKYKGNALVLRGDYKDEGRNFTAKFLYANASGDSQPSTDNKDKSFHNGDFLMPAGMAGVSDLRFGEILSNSNTLAAIRPQVGPGLDTGANGEGLNVVGLGGTFTPPNWADGKVTFSLDYFKAKVNDVPSGADDGVGDEIDFAVKYRHSDTVAMALGYARLSPDTGLVAGFVPATNVTTDEITKAWAKLKIRWGGEREEDAAYAHKAARPAAARPAPRPAAAPAAPARRR